MPLIDGRGKTYLRKRRLTARILRGKREQPIAHLLAQRCHIHAAVESGKVLQLAQRGGELGSGSAKVAALKMMEGARQLNQRLQKNLLLVAALNPDALPVLVSEEELLAAVAAESVGKRPEIEIQFHLRGTDYHSRRERIFSLAGRSRALPTAGWPMFHSQSRILFDITQLARADVLCR